MRLYLCCLVCLAAAARVCGSATLPCKSDASLGLYSLRSSPSGNDSSQVCFTVVPNDRAGPCRGRCCKAPPSSLRWSTVAGCEGVSTLARITEGDRQTEHRPDFYQSDDQTYFFRLAHIRVSASDRICYRLDRPWTKKNNARDRNGSRKPPCRQPDLFGVYAFVDKAQKCCPTSTVSSLPPSPSPHPPIPPLPRSSPSPSPSPAAPAVPAPHPPIPPLPRSSPPPPSPPVSLESLIRPVLPPSPSPQPSPSPPVPPVPSNPNPPVYTAAGLSKSVIGRVGSRVLKAVVRTTVTS